MHSLLPRRRGTLPNCSSALPSSKPQPLSRCTPGPRPRPPGAACRALTGAQAYRAGRQGRRPARRPARAGAGPRRTHAPAAPAAGVRLGADFPTCARFTTLRSLKKQRWPGGWGCVRRLTCTKVVSGRVGSRGRVCGGACMTRRGSHTQGLHCIISRPSTWSACAPARYCNSAGVRI